TTPAPVAPGPSAAPALAEADLAVPGVPAPVGEAPAPGPEGLDDLFETGAGCLPDGPTRSDGLLLAAALASACPRDDHGAAEGPRSNRASATRRRDGRRG